MVKTVRELEQIIPYFFYYIFIIFIIIGLPVINKTFHTLRCKYTDHYL